jgi:hypothetical protein
MAKPKAVVEDEKPFWEKEEYVRYLMKANSPGKESDGDSLKRIQNF